MHYLPKSALHLNLDVFPFVSETKRRHDTKTSGAFMSIFKQKDPKNEISLLHFAKINLGPDWKRNRNHRACNRCSKFNIDFNFEFLLRTTSPVGNDGDTRFQWASQYLCTLSRHFGRILLKKTSCCWRRTTASIDSGAYRGYPKTVKCFF